MQIFKFQREFIKQLVDKQYELQPEFKKYGPEGYQKSLQDASYNLSFLEEAATLESPQLIIDYCQWTGYLFQKLGLPSTTLVQFWTLTLKLSPQILSEKTFQEIKPYLETAIRSSQTPVKETPSFINKENPQAELLEKYLDLIIRQKRQEASRFIISRVEDGLPLRELYLYVFQPFQYEIGRLWHSNQITVAQEHYATASTQLIMSQLYPYVFTDKGKKYNALCSCIQGELHELGIRMIADFLEVEGWNTLYLGANMPNRDILALMQKNPPDLFAVSCTMTFHLDRLIQLLEEVRNKSKIAHPPLILVGGYPFNIDSGLWKKVYADGSASNFEATLDFLHKRGFT